MILGHAKAVEVEHAEGFKDGAAALGGIEVEAGDFGNGAVGEELVESGNRALVHSGAQPMGTGVLGGG